MQPTDAPAVPSEARQPACRLQHILFLLRKVDCNDGIASYCQTLASGLAARGISVSMISGQVNADTGSQRRREDLQHALAHWLSFPGLSQYPQPRLLAKFVAFIKENNIAAINVHGLGMLMWGKALSLAAEVPLVATYHPSLSGDMDSPGAASASSFTRMQKLFLRLFRPDRLVVLSEEAKDFIERQCPPIRPRIVKIYGGIDNAFFRPPSPGERLAARAKFGLQEVDVLCLLVGRLTWNKGQDLLVRAARQVRTERPDVRFKCFFVGSGGSAQVDAIKQLALVDEADRQAFSFFGYVDDVREAMWAADMLALPSRLEGFALVVAEAMSTGLVPIRTPSGGCADQIMHGRTGFIVPFEDVDALAGAMLALTDADTRAAMSRECLTLARTRFSRDALVDRTTAVIGELIS